jgi:hypothetical protein
MMKLGSWSIRLRDPSLFDDLVYLGHVVILPQRVRLPWVNQGIVASTNLPLGDAGMLSVARWSGVLREKQVQTVKGQPDALILAGSGLDFWLADEDGKGYVLETERAYSADTFDDVMNRSGSAPYGLLRDDAGAELALTIGAVHSVGGTYTGTHKFQNQREALRYALDVFGAEYRIHPDFSIDVGAEDDLYLSAPAANGPNAVVVRRSALGADPSFDGVPAGAFGTAQDVKDFTTRVLMLGEGSGVTLKTGSADIVSNPYDDPGGSDVVRVRIVNEAETSEGNADARAQLQLNRFSGTRDALTLSTDEFDIEGVAVPGDTVYVYDPEAGLVDTANEIRFRGEVLNPKAIRLLGATWPVVEGMGIYYRRQYAGGLDWIDLTDHVIFEEGATQLEVGSNPRSLTAENEPAAASGRIFTDVGSGDDKIPDEPPHTSTPWATSSYVDAEGRTRSQIVVSWSQPLNTDATAITDGSHYVVRWRRSGETDYQYAAVGWGTTSFLLQDLSPGVTYEISVEAVDTFSPPNRSGFLADESVVAGPDTVPPSTPAAPTVAGNPLELQIEHTLGKSTGGTFNLETDLDHLNVYISTTSGFTPSAANLAGKIPANAGHLSLGIKVIGTFQIVDVSTRYVKVTAVDKAGNESPASAQTSQTATLISNAHIADLSVSKLSAGTINTGTISVASTIETASGGIIRTAGASANRVEMGGSDPDRISFFSGNPDETESGIIRIFELGTPPAETLLLQIKAPSNSVGGNSIALQMQDESGDATVGPVMTIAYGGASSILPELRFQNSFQIQVDSNGTDARPALAILSDTDTGLHGGGDNLVFVAGGAEIFRIAEGSAGAAKNVQFNVGSKTWPSVTWRGDTDSGMYWKASDDWALTAGGQEIARLRDSAASSNEGSFVVYDHDESSIIFPGKRGTFTPTLRASTTAPTLGSGSVAVGHYWLIGTFVYVFVYIKFGTSGVNKGSGVYYFDFNADDSNIPDPESAIYTSNRFFPVGDVMIRDITSSPRHVGMTSFDSTWPRMIMWADDSGGAVADTVPMTFAASDEIHARFMYPRTFV